MIEEAHKLKAETDKIVAQKLKAECEKIADEAKQLEARRPEAERTREALQEEQRQGALEAERKKLGSRRAHRGGKKECRETTGQRIETIEAAARGSRAQQGRARAAAEVEAKNQEIDSRLAQAEESVKKRLTSEEKRLEVLYQRQTEQLQNEQADREKALARSWSRN